jgi:hypothetical protein
MVMTNKMIKYITSIGQNTGILNASKNVQNVATTTAFVPEYLKSNKTYYYAATYTLKDW